MPLFRFLTWSGSDHTSVSQTGFFSIFFLTKTSMAIPRSHRLGFLKSFFWPGTSVNIPRTRSVRPGYGHWRISLNYQKKTGLTDSGMATGVKKPGLWDRGMAPDVRMQTEIEKIPRCDRQWCGHWGYKNPVCQTKVWPTELQNSVWPVAG